MGIIQQTIVYHSDNNFISEYRHTNPTLGSGNYTSYYSQHFFGKHVVDDAGFIYVTGRSGRFGGSYFPADATTRSISKLTPMGQVIFTKDLDDLDVYINQLFSADNHIYAIGYRKFVVDSSGNDKGDDSLLIKLTNDLNIVWFRMLGNNDNFNFFEEFTGLAIDSSNNVYVSGEGTGGGSSASTAVVKYNSSGTQQWKKLINYNTGTQSTSESFYADYIHIDSSGNLYLAGRTNNAGGGNKNNGTPSCNGYFLRSCHVKLNSSGSVLWKKARRARWTVSGTGSYAGCYHHYAAGHVTGGVDSNGNLYSAQNHRSLSYIPSYNSFRSDAFSLLKRNSSGTLQWEKNFYVTNTSDSAYSTGTAQELQFDNDDNIYLATNSNFHTTSLGSNYYPERMIILKFNSSGVLQWARKIARSNIANAQSHSPSISAFKVDKNKESFTISGNFRDDNALAGTYQGFILKLPIDGSKTGTYGYWIYSEYTGLTFSDNHPNSNVDISGVEYSTSNITSNSNNMADRSSVSANNTTITTGAHPAANYLENIP